MRIYVNLDEAEQLANGVVPSSIQEKIRDRLVKSLAHELGIPIPGQRTIEELQREIDREMNGHA